MHLVELIQSYFPEHINHSSKENEILIKCPFCEGHTATIERITLGINTQTEIGHCHRCDWRAGGRNLYWALADEVNVKDDYETDNDLADTSSRMADKKTFKKILKRIALPKEFEPLWTKDKLDHLGRKAKNYLLDRGITDGQIKRHRIGFCGAGKYSYRVILPIMYTTHIVGFTARSFAGAEPKYLNSDGEKFLYGYPRKERKSRCLLVEGPFDALNIEKYCDKEYDCIGRFGAILTDLQLKVLAKYDSVTVWTDPNKPGVDGAIACAKRLKEETTVKVFAVMPDRHIVDRDPGELTGREVRAGLKRIKPWSEYVVNKLLVSVLF